MRRLLLLIVLFCLTVTPLAFAQEDTELYEDQSLGIAFDKPDNWEVRTTFDTLIAGAPEALAALDEGQVPDDLVLRIVTGNFIDLNIENAAALPDQLARLVPTGIDTPPATPATYGNRDGWEIQYTVGASNLTSRVALVSLQGGRLALIRGVASTDFWNVDGETLYETLKGSMEFSLPTNMIDPFANLFDTDGGVFWHYQASQPDDALPVTLGGIAFDPFDLIYAAAGTRGVLVIDQTDGSFVNYLGSWFDDDNIADLAIPPDAKIYAANATSGDNNQIMIVNRAGSFEFGFGSSGDAPGQFAPNMPQTITVTRQSDIWTVSEGHSEAPFKRLYKFDRFGNLLTNIDLDTINPDLSGIRIDFNLNDGALYLVGETGGLNILDGTGSPLVTNLGTDVFSVTTPTDIAIAPSNNIIIATSTEGFLEFAPSGALLDRFGIPVPEDTADRFQAGEMRHPTGVVIGLDGMGYFAETNPNSGISQVQAFRFAGDGVLPLPNRPTTSQSNTTTTVNIEPSAGGDTIEYGAVIQGNINNQYNVQEWYFLGSFGDTVRITMQDISSASTLDSLVLLLNPNRFQVAANDDIGDLAPDGFKDTDSVLEFELQNNGYFTIQATRFGGRGEYELKLELLNGDE